MSRKTSLDKLPPRASKSDHVEIKLRDIARLVAENPKFQRLVIREVEALLSARLGVPLREHKKKSRTGHSEPTPEKMARVRALFHHLLTDDEFAATQSRGPATDAD